MRIIGIDPGLSGAAFFYDTITHEFTVHTFKAKDGKLDVVLLREYLFLTQPDAVFIEKIFLTGREGGQSVMTIGSNYGRILAALEMSHLTYTEVPPRVWQRALGLKGGSRAIVKEEAKDFAVKRFTLMPFLFGKSKKPNDGCTDAACIALYGQLTLENSCAPEKKSTKSTRTSAPSSGTRAKRSTSSKDKPVSSKPNLKSKSKKPKLPVKAK
jgi:Holliday junction resolvasome RuvABC endonuclease subunit